MRNLCYRFLGFYHILMGAQLSVVIMITAGILLKKTFSSAYHSVVFTHVGLSLFVLLAFFMVSLLAIRSGLLLMKKVALGIRGCMIVQVPQLLSWVSHSVTYVFHLGLFYGIGFYRVRSLARVWRPQSSLMGSAVFHLGSPQIRGQMVPISIAVYVNLTAVLCLLSLFFLAHSERVDRQSLPELSADL
jgi:hypothetical protein